MLPTKACVIKVKVPCKLVRKIENKSQRSWLAADRRFRLYYHRSQSNRYLIGMKNVDDVTAILIHTIVFKIAFLAGGFWQPLVWDPLVVEGKYNSK